VLIQDLTPSVRNRKPFRLWRPPEFRPSQSGNLQRNPHHPRQRLHRNHYGKGRSDIGEVMKSIQRNCIFCGNLPENKNLEHILPKWLIELTGDPNRIVTFGFDRNSSAVRKFAYKEFKFPSCGNCNTIFSGLENPTKEVVVDMLNLSPIPSISFNILLDWFDKVRIGLWLGFMRLNKNYAGISPKFHIIQRIGLSDRMLLILRVDSDWEGLSFFGTEFPLFDRHPSYLAIRINNLLFVNVDTDFLFSRRLGLPYPTKSIMDENDNSNYFLTKGRKRVMKPLIRGFYDNKCTQIYQPMIREEFLKHSTFKDYYKCDYVEKKTHPKYPNRGIILVNRSIDIVDYPVQHSKIWYSDYLLNPDDQLNYLTKNYLFFSELIINEFISNFEELEIDHRKRWKNNIQSFRRFNRFLDNWLGS